MDKARALRLLREKGVVRAELNFAGGNDEGGVEDEHYYDKNGAELKIEWTNKEVDLLHEPVYEKYSTFAGDFHVYGVVIYDVEAGTVVMKQNESIPHYESSESRW